MPDVVDAATRSRMMSGIRGRNTKPELLVRSGLHRLGYRFRLHDRQLPGRPDLVFPSRRAVIEVKGCFWHGHNCHLFRWPGTRQALLDDGWRVAEVWECELKGRERRPLDEVLSQLAEFLGSSASRCVIGADQTVAVATEV